MKEIQHSLLTIAFKQWGELYELVCRAGSFPWTLFICQSLWTATLMQ